MISIHHCTKGNDKVDEAAWGEAAAFRPEKRRHRPNTRSMTIAVMEKAETSKEGAAHITKDEPSAKESMKTEEPSKGKDVPHGEYQSIKKTMT